MPYTRQHVSDNYATGFPGINPASFGQFGNAIGSYLGGQNKLPFNISGDSIGSAIGNVLGGKGGGLPFNISGDSIGSTIGNAIGGQGKLPFQLPGGFSIPGGMPFNIPGGGGLPFGLPSDIKGTYHYLNKLLRGGQRGENPYHPATTVFNSSEKRKYVRRGSNPQDDPLYIKDVLIQNKECILKENKIKPPSDKVWSEIKSKYSISKSSKALYTFVKCNKWDIQYELGILKRNDEPGSSNSNEEDSPLEIKNSESETEDCVETVPRSSNFKLYIPKEKWKIIEPIEKAYARTSKKGTDRLPNKRRYTVLKPGIWTDVLNTMIWDAIKWPCSWIYKGNYISTSDTAKYWILIRAQCGCGNRLFAYCLNPPPSEPSIHGLELNVDVWGEKSLHVPTEIRRRPFAGEKRRKLGEEMIDKGLRASHVRKVIASDIMEVQDPYPSHLPSNEVVRKIKSESMQARRLDQDVVRAIQLLKYSSSNVFRNNVHDIGLDPFFVHIWNPNHVKIYNLYCKNTYSRLILDATGKLFQKIPIPCGGTSGHIFLYLGVVRLPGEGEGLIPVVQMFSERHNANAIEFWLKEWLRVGEASVPCEVVLDDSAALISATSRAVAGEPSTAEYLKKSLLFLQGEESMRPKCLIRIDVAHFTNLIRRWPQICSLKKRTKEFFIRAVIIVAKAESIDAAEDLLRAIFIVALSETEGISGSTGNPTPCEIHKKLILSMIAGLDVTELLAEIGEIQEEEDFMHFDQQEDNRRQDRSQIKLWIDNIENQAMSSIIDDGDRDNIMHQPAVAKRIKKLCYIFPLWSNALAKKMNSPFPRAIGAYVEEEIGQLKANLLKETVRADDFLRQNLIFCDGALKIAATMPVVDPSQRMPNEKDQGTTTINQESPPLTTTTVTTSLNSTNGQQSQSVRGTRTYGEHSYCKNPRTNKKTSSTAFRRPECPACSSGDMPGGAHKCVKCQRPVHALEGCSKPFGKEMDEGYGQKRVCFKCTTESQKKTKPKDFPKKRRPTLITKTSIVDREDLTIKTSTSEPTSVEGWRGLSLPKRKKPSGFYWKPNADFPLLPDSSKSNRIGILKNGMCSTLKFIDINKTPVTLTNTCSFDAPLQIFATAFSDSETYRDCLRHVNCKETILEMAELLATKGVNKAVYQLRAKLLSKYFEGDRLKGGVIQINCLMDASALLRKMDFTPSVLEKRICNSPYCSKKLSERRVTLLSAMISEEEIQNLQSALAQGDAADETNCLLPMVDVTGLPQEAFIIDPQLSLQGPLCSGTCKRQRIIGPHLIIEVVGDQERVHTNSRDFGVLNAVSVSLTSIPKTISMNNSTFHLRGIVEFKPPHQDIDAGHYRGLSFRTDGTWEVFDDLKDKVDILKGNTAMAHIIVYTV